MHFSSAVRVSIGVWPGGCFLGVKETGSVDDSKLNMHGNLLVGFVCDRSLLLDGEAKKAERVSTDVISIHKFSI